jgi:NTP pyrophosphatase (non-canonical NTP hydrolase)
MASIEKLLEIMAKLRDPETGCPWDVEQDFSTIAPYTVEEAYEVADAIAREDLDGLRDELGDLLFQVAFHARMAEEGGAFDFEAVAEGICDKMIRRHPHVFGSAEERQKGPEKGAWHRIKASERSAREEGSSALDGVAQALPALKRAEKLGANWRRPVTRDTQATRPRNSAMSCLRSSTWPGISASTLSKPWSVPTGSLNGVFAPWNRTSQPPAWTFKTSISTCSKRTGRPPRQREKTVHKPFSFGAKTAVCVQPGFIAPWLFFVPGSVLTPGHVNELEKEHETETLDYDNIEFGDRVAGPGC